MTSDGERRLLILDDDPLIGQTTLRVARSMGGDARLTTDARAFFDAYESWRPTHIALDLVMPDMDGVEVIAELARRGCDAQLIILSGVGDRVLQAAARSAVEHGLRVAGTLAKPFSVASLRAMLRAEVISDDGVTRAPPRPGSDVAPLDEAEIRRAIEGGELRLAYQPKVTCRGGALSGFEALVRWEHPARGVVPPDAFLPDVERLGLMDDLTQSIVDQGLAWLSRAFPDGDMLLAINVSGRTVSLPGVDAGGGARFADRMTAHCERHRITPSRVIIELTETSAMADPIASLDTMTRLRMRGFRLSLDDFGTGFSSMVELARLPFSEMKIDRSFVSNATRSRESRAIIRSVIGLAHSLRMQCVAEGVEDERTLAMLVEMGCDLAQGFFIGRPMWDHQVPGWLEQHGQGSSHPSG